MSEIVERLTNAVAGRYAIERELVVNWIRVSTILADRGGIACERSTARFVR